MKSNTKSSITLPPEELRLVESLRKRLGARTKVEVVRRGLRLLKETTDRQALKKAFAEASQAVRQSTTCEIDELDHLAGEGLDEA
jgi:Arc/MetJ-type ribon-helix-helix transcriptional regulator